MNLLRLSCILAALNLSAAASAAGPELFPIDLGSLGGGESSAAGLNDLGQVVGWSRDAQERKQAFVWANGSMTGLGFLPGGTSSVATAINRNGDVAGYSYVSPSNYHGFVHSSGSMTSIGTWGSPYSLPRAINDHRVLAGSSPPPNTAGINSGFLWRTNQFVRIPAPVYPDADSCDANGLDNASRVCGCTRMWLQSGQDRWWAFLWRDANSNAVHDSGEMELLGSLSPSFPHSGASAMNDLGQVVGWSTVANAWSPIHAFLVTPSNSQWKLPSGSSVYTNALMQSLGVLGGPAYSSWANDVNNHSWVVGIADMPSGTNQAFLWRNGTMTNLNDLIPPDSGWVLTSATGINDFNEIAGNGLFNGLPRAFLLRASPGLSVAATNGAAIYDSELPCIPKGTDFGSVPIGQSVTNTFLLRNLASSNLSVFGWTTNGPDAARFLVSGIPSILQAGGSSNFSVVFSPSAAGVFQASLAFDSDSPASISNLLFSGTGVRHPQTILFPPLGDQLATNRLSLAASASSGLPVAFHVASGPAEIANVFSLFFSGSGVVSVVASQPGDVFWAPAPPISNVFSVSKAPAYVSLHGLDQTYDGSPKPVSASTQPDGLNVLIAYDGSPDAPILAGSFSVAASVAEALWEGSATGLLVVARANQSIDFPPIPDQFIADELLLSATADSGLAVQFSVDSGPASLLPGNRLSFSSTGPVAVAASQPGDSNWNPASPVARTFDVWGLFDLSVASAHGDPNPGAGIHSFLLGAVLTNSVAAPPPAGGTQLVCLGWSLANHDPSSGTSSVFSVAITNHAALTWLWATNFWLETDAGPHGSISPPSSWLPARLPAAISPIPNPYFHFLRWTNDASGSNSPLELFMDAPKSVRAFFAENLAAHDTPEWWLAQFGWTNHFDAAALADAEPDGFPTWQEFVADTDPANPLSFPSIAWIETLGTNPPLVQWSASSNRAYQIHWTDGGPDAAWSTQQLFLGASEWSDPNPSPSMRLYRIAPLRPAPESALPIR